MYSFLLSDPKRWVCRGAFKVMWQRIPSWPLPPRWVVHAYPRSWKKHSSYTRTGDVVWRRDLPKTWKYYSWVGKEPEDLSLFCGRSLLWHSNSVPVLNLGPETIESSCNQRVRVPLTGTTTGVQVWEIELNRSTDRTQGRDFPGILGENRLLLFRGSPVHWTSSGVLSRDTVISWSSEWSNRYLRRKDLVVNSGPKFE